MSCIAGTGNSAAGTASLIAKVVSALPSLNTSIRTSTSTRPLFNAPGPPRVTKRRVDSKLPVTSIWTAVSWPNVLSKLANSIGPSRLCAESINKALVVQSVR